MKLKTYTEFINESEVNEFISGTLLDIKKGPGDVWQLPISKRWAAIGPLGWRQAYKANRHGKKNAEMWSKTGTDRLGHSEKQMIKDDQLIYEGRAMGDCYQAAGRLIMEWSNPKSILVHGMVNGQGPLDGIRFGHAWVEKGNKVYDYSNGRELTMAKGKYYSIGDIKPKDNKYYKWRDSLKWMVDEGHWGPWEMSGATEPVMENLPDEADEIGQLRQEIRDSELIKIKNS